MNKDEIIKKAKREYSRRYREKNRQKIREYNRQYRREHKEQRDEYNRRYWLKKARQYGIVDAHEPADSDYKVLFVTQSNLFVTLTFRFNPLEFAHPCIQGAYEAQLHCVEKNTGVFIVLGVVGVNETMLDDIEPQLKEVVDSRIHAVGVSR